MRRAGIHLATGEKARIDFDLAVGNISEQVTVTADAPMLRADTASLGNVVEHEQVVQLPLNGRTFITLATLAPGVALPPNTQFPRINGGRPRTNEYLFDGISVLQPEPGQVAFFPVIDAIQEFKIESNSPPAEFGRFNGGVINLTTKSGTNVFHGNGFEFFRNQSLNARNFFQSTNPVKPDYRRNQFGGTFGGPMAARSHVLLRGLSGAATVDRPDGHLHGADRCCSGRGSSPKRSRAGCRSSTIRPRPSGSTRTSVYGQRDSVGAHGSGRAVAAAALSAADSARERRTTTAGRRAKSTTRISGTCVSITSSPSNRDRCSADSRTSATASCR